MIRLIVKTVGYAPVNDAIAEVSFETFLIDAPKVERFLKEIGSYGSRFIIGGAIEAPPVVVEASEEKTRC